MYLVTGCAGFIGSTLCDALLSQGKNVRGIDSFTDYYDPKRKQENIRSARENGLELVEGDLLSTDMDALFSDVDTVIHLAGQPGVRKSWGTEFSIYVKGNIEATQHLLEWTRWHPVKRFVYASSSSVYGDAESYPTSEGMRPAPISPYGVTKLAGEHLVSLYGSNFGLSTVSLRFFTVYGPRQRTDMAFHRFITAALQREPIDVFGDGEQIRDFTYVDDVVSAIISASDTAGIRPAEVLNLAGGSSTSVNQVLGIIGEYLGCDLNVRYTDVALGDVRRTGGDATRAKMVLDWEPRVLLEDGIRKQVDRLKSEMC